MTNTPKLWKDMTDAEKGELLLACHNGETLQSHWSRGWSDLYTFEPRLYPRFAYRIKPKGPKVETVQSESHVWINDESTPQVGSCHDGSDVTIANITHTYTITDGIVTSCDTVIHKNGEADQ